MSFAFIIMNRDYTPYACVTLAGMIICFSITQWKELRSAYGTFGQLDRPLPAPVVQIQRIPR